MHDPLATAREAFLSAPLSEGGWSRALEALSDGTGATRGQIVAFGDDFTVPFNVMTNVDDAWYREFLEMDGANPAVNWRLACVAAPLEVMSERHYDSVRAAYRGTVYDEFAIRCEMENGCQTVLSRDHGAFFGLATTRATREGRTAEAQLAFFAQASAYALAAVRMQVALQSQAAALVTRTLHAMHAAAFVVDRQGRVIDHTPLADAMLAEGSHVALDGRTLRAKRPGEQDAFLKALRRVDAGDPAAAMWLAGRAEGEGRRCEIYRLPAREWAFAAQPHFVVVVRTPRQAGGAEAMLLQHAFQLTATEADVAALLAEGHARDAIAAQRGTSPHTVQAQIRSIFGKTGVTRESALVALLRRVLG